MWYEISSKMVGCLLVVVVVVQRPTNSPMVISRLKWKEFAFKDTHVLLM